MPKLLQLFSSAALRSAEEARLPLQQTRESKASQIISYVETHFSDIASVHEIAERFQVSDGYVFHIFRQHRGMTPKQLILEQKLKVFQHRVCNSDQPLHLIARGCGFDCYAYFCRMFQAKYHCSPSEYRSQLRSGVPPSPTASEAFRL